MTTFSEQLKTSNEYRLAKKNLIEVILKKSAEIKQIRPAQSTELSEKYLKDIAEFQAGRGRELYFPYLASGIGNGALIELTDGSVKYDFISGIGVQFFGHTNPELMEAVVEGLSSDVMQGNLQPGIEVAEFTKEALRHVKDVSRLRHVWLACSGTMVNEVALKIIRQKKFPATKVLTFRDCFAGRSTAMQEITDNPKYREGQPTYGEVEYLPFYDEKLGLEKSIEQTLSIMRENFSKYPGKFAALMIELVQGEGGIHFAPREFYLRVFEEAKKAGLAIWIDEIQTFGRTGELFAFQTFGLNDYPDVVTAAKLLQASVAFYTDEFNPKPGLIAGTFVGSTAALRAGRRVLEIFREKKLLGPQGQVNEFANYFRDKLVELSEGSCKGLMSEIRVIGAMVAFKPMQGTMDQVKALLMKYFSEGLIAFYAGHDPYVIRMLPPFAVLTKPQMDEVIRLIEKGLLEVGQQEIGTKK